MNVLPIRDPGESYAGTLGVSTLKENRMPSKVKLQKVVVIFYVCRRQKENFLTLNT
jgi:hypothetical protein